MQMCDNILEKNRESQAAVIQGYQTILNALAKRMEAGNITEEERKSITEDMISVADKIAEADLQNKKLLERQVTKILWGILGVALLIGGGIGINSAIGGSGELLRVTDNDDETMA